MQNHHLSEREENEAYLTAKEGINYMLYFPKSGNVKIDLSSYMGEFSGKWISVSSGEWGDSHSLDGGKNVDILTPDDSGWFLVIKK
jgi:hypothetical protein